MTDLQPVAFRPDSGQVAEHFAACAAELGASTDAADWPERSSPWLEVVQRNLLHVDTLVSIPAQAATEQGLLIDPAPGLRTEALSPHTILALNLRHGYETTIRILHSIRADLDAGRQPAVDLNDLFPARYSPPGPTNPQEIAYDGTHPLPLRPALALGLMIHLAEKQRAARPRVIEVSGEARVRGNPEHNRVEELEPTKHSLAAWVTGGPAIDLPAYETRASSEPNPLPPRLVLATMQECLQTASAAALAAVTATMVG